MADFYSTANDCYMYHINVKLFCWTKITEILWQKDVLAITGVGLEGTAAVATAHTDVTTSVVANA